MGGESDSLVAVECLRATDVVVEDPVPLAPELNSRLNDLVVAQYGGTEAALQGVVEADRVGLRGVLPGESRVPQRV